MKLRRNSIYVSACPQWGLPTRTWYIETTVERSMTSFKCLFVTQESDIKSEYELMQSRDLSPGLKRQITHRLFEIALQRRKEVLEVV
jgi:hypothetical protein